MRTNPTLYEIVLRILLNLESLQENQVCIHSTTNTAYEQWRTLADIHITQTFKRCISRRVSPAKKSGNDVTLMQ